MSTEVIRTTPLLILKLGGAALTNKEIYRTLKFEAIQECARTIRLLHSLGYAIILIHGAGSFGHFEAKEYGLNSKKENDKNKQTIYGVAKCRSSLLRLHTELVDILVNEESLPVLSVPVFSLSTPEPLVRRFSFSSSSTPNPKRRSMDNIEEENMYSSVDMVPAYVNMTINILQQGGIPILHGDPVLLSSMVVPLGTHSICNNNDNTVCTNSSLVHQMNTTIVSGDTIVDIFTVNLQNYIYRIQNLTIYYRWSIPLVLFITGSDGVFNFPPNLPHSQLFQYVYVSSNSTTLSLQDDLSNITIQYENSVEKIPYTTIQSSLQTSLVGADVTGGIQAKLQHAIRMVEKAMIKNPKLSVSQSKVPVDSFMVSIIGIPAFTKQLYDQLREKQCTMIHEGNENTEESIHDDRTEVSKKKTNLPSLYLPIDFLPKLVKNLRGTHILETTV